MKNEIESKPLPVRPSLYAMYYQVLKDVAYNHGYNLCIHGSMNRDFDLVAFPWKKDCTKNHFTVANEMRESIGGQFNEGEGSACEGGSIWYPINIWRNTPFTDEKDQQYYLDLKIYPFPAMHSLTPSASVQERAKEYAGKNAHPDDPLTVIAYNAYLAGASGNGMRWVKASERLPEKNGRYFVKVDRVFSPDQNDDKRQVCMFTGTEWYLENHHHSRDFFYCKPYEWLDEQPSPMQEEVERLREALELLIKDAKYMHVQGNIHGTFEERSSVVKATEALTKYPKIEIEDADKRIERGEDGWG